MPLKKNGFLFYYQVLRVICLLWSKSFVKYMICNFFFHSVACLFILLTVSLKVQTLEVPFWHHGLRIQCFHSCGAGNNCRVCLMFDPWPGNFNMPQVRPKKTKKKTNNPAPQKKTPDINFDEVEFVNIFIYRDSFAVISNV